MSVSVSGEFITEMVRWHDDIEYYRFTITTHYELRDDKSYTYQSAVVPPIRQEHMLYYHLDLVEHTGVWSLEARIRVDQMASKTHRRNIKMLVG